ncbi:MAG: DNA topoisomerase III [Gammaproteobacteria bacterium]|nr:DNA topoisomerase III [Gammaproteobacteria bacterium]
MKLIIAEKPSLGRTIAAALGGGRKGNGCIISDDWTVTWAFGHMYEQAMPDSYLAENVPSTQKGTKVWRLEDLPIIPQRWILNPRDDAKQQLNIIAGLLKNATEVTHAGDPDREGQLLVDEILLEMGWNGTTQRVWLQDLTQNGIRNAFKHIRPNNDYRGLYEAAVSRSRCDWLLGMNVTRAFTLCYQKAGGDGVISVGRVQTPTLNLIVERDRQIENFVPLPYYTIKAQFDHENGIVATQWVPSEDDSDPDGRCLKRAVAEQVCTRVQGQTGTICNASRKKKREGAPLPFSLSALQTVANARWGYGAQQVLDAAQKLYEEHKLTTYPRTDCGYLASGQHADAKIILKAIGEANPQLVKDTDLSRKSKAFNDSKVTAHTGIIPTAKRPDVSRLPQIERNLYGLIARHYVAQFLPDHEYQVVEVEIECCKEKFTGKGKKTLVVGWKNVLPPQKKEAADLPLIKKGDTAMYKSAELTDKKTKPLSRFTEGTLITAMAGIARYVENPKVKSVLRESAGIGTEATRASIIETLKQRNYVQLKGKIILSTEHGRHFIDSVPGRIKDPAVTAWWEQQMSEIAEENADATIFLEKMTGWMCKLVASATPEQFRAAAKANPKKERANGSNNLPTPKMIQLAKSIAKNRNLKLPRGYTKSFDITRKFLDAQLG